MAEETEGGVTRTDHVADGLSPPIFDSRPEYAEVGGLLDEARSSSLSDLEDGTDEVEMISAISVLSRHIEADSEAETELLENSPHKSQNHERNELGVLRYTQSPGKLVHAAVPLVKEQEIFSDSGVSSPGPSDEELQSEVRSERSAASDNEDNIAVQIRESSPRKRKHQDIEDGSDSEGDASEEARRRRRRTNSVRSDAEDQSELGMSREATIEPMVDGLENQDASDMTTSLLRNEQNILRSKVSKPAIGKHGRTKGRKSLKNIVEEGEDSGNIADSGVDEARAASDDDQGAEGEDEDVEAAAKNEEECKTGYPQRVRPADNP